jgi:hypothetical protein
MATLAMIVPLGGHLPSYPVDPDYGRPVFPPIARPPIYYPPVDPGYGRPPWSPVDPGWGVRPPVDPGYGRPPWSPIDPGWGVRPPVDPGYGRPVFPPIATLPIYPGQPPAYPLPIPPPEKPQPPNFPGIPIGDTGWMVDWWRGTGWVLVPPDKPPEAGPKA